MRQKFLNNVMMIAFRVNIPKPRWKLVLLAFIYLKQQLGRSPDMHEVAECLRITAASASGTINQLVKLGILMRIEGNKLNSAHYEINTGKPTTSTELDAQAEPEMYEYPNHDQGVRVPSAQSH